MHARRCHCLMSCNNSLSQDACTRVHARPLTFVAVPAPAKVLNEARNVCDRQSAIKSSA